MTLDEQSESSDPEARPLTPGSRGERLMTAANRRDIDNARCSERRPSNEGQSKHQDDGATFVLDADLLDVLQTNQINP